MGCSNNWCFLLVLMLLMSEGGCGNGYRNGCNCCCDNMCQKNNDCGCGNGCC